MLLSVGCALVLVATPAALGFGVGEDYALPLAAVLTVAVLVWPRAPHPRAASRLGRPIELGF